jgi:hypothetical protein
MSTKSLHLISQVEAKTGKKFPMQMHPQPQGWWINGISWVMVLDRGDQSFNFDVVSYSMYSISVSAEKSDFSINKQNAETGS